jgi:hypothetical protein
MKRIIAVLVSITAAGVGVQVAQQTHLFWGLVAGGLTLLFGLMALVSDPAWS